MEITSKSGGRNHSCVCGLNSEDSVDPKVSGFEEHDPKPFTHYRRCEFLPWELKNEDDVYTVNAYIISDNGKELHDTRKVKREGLQTLDMCLVKKKLRVRYYDEYNKVRELCLDEHTIGEQLPSPNRVTILAESIDNCTKSHRTSLAFQFLMRKPHALWNNTYPQCSREIGQLKHFDISSYLDRLTHVPLPVFTNTDRIDLPLHVFPPGVYLVCLKYFNEKVCI